MSLRRNAVTSLALVALVAPATPAAEARPAVPPRAAAGTVLFQAQCHVWSVQTDGTHRRKVSQGKTCHHISDVSADGKWLLFTVSDFTGGAPSFDIYKRTVTGGKPIALTTDHASYGGRFSPSGTRISFTRFDSALGHGSGVYLMSASGTHRHLVTENAGTSSWSPTGSALYYDRLSGKGDAVCPMYVGALVRRTVSSGAEKTVAPGAAHQDTFPTDASGPGVLGDRWTCNAAGTSRDDVTLGRKLVARSARGATWSSDGRWVAYQHTLSSGSTDGKIRIAKPDGSHAHVLKIGDLGSASTIW